VLGSLVRFFESSGDLMSLDDSDKFWTLARGESKFYSRRWSQPRIVDSQPEWAEHRSSDLGGVHSPLVWDIG
jgi:hypothetical protein